MCKDIWVSSSFGLNFFLQEGALLKLLSSSWEITGPKTRQILKQSTKPKSHQPFKMAEFTTALLSTCIWPRLWWPCVTHLPKLGTAECGTGWGGNMRARTLTGPPWPPGWTFLLTVSRFRFSSWRDRLLLYNTTRCHSLWKQFQAVTSSVSHWDRTNGCFLRCPILLVKLKSP